MSREITFDWFSLDRNSLFNLLYSSGHRVIDQSLSIDQFHNRLVYQIKKHLPIKFRKTKNPKVINGWVWVGGAYYSDKDEEGDRSIEIDFCYNSNQQNITITRKRFSRVCMGFADTILHELIHMRQHRRRQWKSTPDFPSTANRAKQREAQEYLGCRDEVDAYAFNIACELHDKFNGNQKHVFRYLDQDHKGANRKHNCYIMYLNAFGHDHNHPIIKQVKKKVASYWPMAKVGKPYRNSEWINH